MRACGRERSIHPSILRFVSRTTSKRKEEKKTTRLLGLDGWMLACAVVPPISDPARIYPDFTVGCIVVSFSFSVFDLYP